MYWDVSPREEYGVNSVFAETFHSMLLIIYVWTGFYIQISQKKKTLIRSALREIVTET